MLFKIQGVSLQTYNSHHGLGDEDLRWHRAVQWTPGGSRCAEQRLGINPYYVMYRVGGSNDITRLKLPEASGLRYQTTRTH